MTLTFEDFPPGHFGTFGPRHVCREEILEFAAEFDPQPMHLDEVAASKSMLEGLAASGWHLCAIMMRMMADGFITRTVSLGSPGVNEVRWLAPLRPGDDVTLKPVLAGDTISFVNEVVSKRTSDSRPGWGILQGRNSGTNQRGEEVFSFLATAFVPMRADFRT